MQCDTVYIVLHATTHATRAMAIDVYDTRNLHYTTVLYIRMTKTAL